MTDSKDPTQAIRRKALALSDEPAGASCNQSSFRTKQGAFLFLGPGAKGQGFKAMFKLEASLAEARKLAAQHPARFEVGATGWVTARFTAEEPLPAKLWGKWLAESHGILSAPAPARGKKATQRSVPRVK